MKSVTIGARPIPQRKTIQNLSEVLEEICLEWDINSSNVKAILTDNGVNIMGACKNVFGVEKHLACFAHSINIVATTSLDQKGNNENLASQISVYSDNEITDDEVTENIEDNIVNDNIYIIKNIIKKIKRIVTFFRKSERANEELKELQQREWEKKESQCLKLIQEVRTRWNSRYDMLDRFLLLCDFVGRVLAKVAREKSSKAKPPLMITSEEEEIIREVRDLLKPLSQVTKEISSEKSVTLSKCIPLVSLLSKVKYICILKNFFKLLKYFLLKKFIFICAKIKISLNCFFF